MLARSCLRPSLSTAPIAIPSALVALLLLVSPAGADWTQFRGENASGIASGAQAFPVRWSATENVAWKTELPGQGSSSAIVHGDAVFVASYTGSSIEVERHLSRIDAASGRILWTKSVPVGHPEDPPKGYILEHGWASSTPVTDGEAVYAYFGKAGVHAFDFDGNVLWKADTGELSSKNQWGSASSPIMVGDLVIVPAGDECRALLGLRKSDGSIAWKAEGDSLEHTYGSPIVVKSGDRTDLVFAVTAEIWGLDPETGKRRWFARYDLPGNMSNTPHVTLDGRYLTISGGFPRTARVALETGGNGDLSSKLLYDTQKPATYMTPPVEHDGVLYWVSDSGIAFAAEPGKADALWEERVPDLNSGKGKPFYASPVLAGGRIYAVSRANGTFVIEPNRDGLKIVARNVIEGDDTIFNATPAVSGGRLFLRSQSHLYCIGAE